MNDAINRLREALIQRQAGGEIVEVFFRDDDIDEDEATLRRLLQLFATRNAPVVLGVIPARLTTAGIALLRQFASTVELVQHGWQHVNHETTGRKCEFGASRSFDEQYDDLSRGQARMTEAFGQHWFPAFIPPWNRCTQVTEQALQQLGFRVVSKLRETDENPDGMLPEISVTLDLYRWKDGAQLKPTEELWQAIVQQVQQGAVIGIMLHHKVMTDDAFLFLEQMLDELKQAANVRFHCLQTLTAEARP